MLGYVDEIEVFSSLSEQSENSFQIRSSINDNSLISESTYSQVYNTLNNSHEISYFISSISFVNTLYLDNQPFGIFEIKIVEFQQLISSYQIIIEYDLANISVLISAETTQLNYYLSSKFNVSFENTIISISDIKEFVRLEEQSADLLIDANSSIIPISLINRWNLLEVYTISNKAKANLIKKLSDIPDIKIFDESPQSQFLKASSNQISKILFITQLLMSVLLILSISYVMLSLVHDSEKDINLLNLIGLRKRDIWIIFQGQAVLSSIISCFIAFLFSLLLLNIIYPILSVSIGLPYATVIVDFSFALQAFVLTFIVGFVSGLYPSFLGVKR